MLLPFLIYSTMSNTNRNFHVKNMFLLGSNTQPWWQHTDLNEPEIHVFDKLEQQNLLQTKLQKIDALNH